MNEPQPTILTLNDKSYHVELPTPEDDMEVMHNEEQN